MRTKRRYLAFEIIGAGKFDEGSVRNSIVRNHLRFAGEKCFQLSSPWLVSFSAETQRGVLRTNLAGLHEIRASLALTTEIDGCPVIIRTLGVSGTIRACEDKFIRKSRPSVLERAERRHEEEDPGRIGRLAAIKALVPGSTVKICRREFRLKQVFADGRIDLESDDGSFGFTILDFLGSGLDSEE